MKAPGRAGPASGRGGAAEGEPMRDDGQHGGITLMLVVLFVGLVAMAGIVIDGGAKLTEFENAAAAAQEAARAGAGIVNPATAYQSGSFSVERQRAIAAARSYMAAAGYQGSVSLLGANSIRVTVSITRPTRALSFLGIDSITSTGTATADLVTGVTGPGT